VLLYICTTQKSITLESAASPYLKKIVWLIWVLFVASVVFLILHVWAVAVNFNGWYGGMPGLENLTNPKSTLASEVYSADGVLLGKYFRENRSEVTYEQISPNVIKALYATEDVRFDEHSGIDLKGLTTIAFYYFSGKKRGSSTITQQLAKNLFETRGELYDGPLTSVSLFRTPIIKTKEWITAISLERTYTKQEILQMYLNTVDFGANSFGIKSAAKTYFATTPDKLKLEEAAVLVGLLKAPTMYSPVINPERALSRRNTVIDQLKKYDFISSEEALKLETKPIALKYKVENQNQGIATYFREELKKDLIRECKKLNLDLYNDGLKIYTTIDSRLQRYAEAAMAKHMKIMQDKFDKYWGKRNPWVYENGKEIENYLAINGKKTVVYKQLVELYNGNTDSVDIAMRTKKKTQVFTWNGEVEKKFNVYDSIAYYKRFLNASLLSVDPATGAIRAWVGGINYKHFKYDHVKQGKRQPGSCFKPILYAAALDNGYHPCDEFVDAPVTIVNADGVSWSPKNSDDNFSGEKMTLRRGMGLSLNSIAAALIQRIGPKLVVEYARKLGIESELDPVYPLALGASDVSLYELVGAYSVFVNNGNYTKPQYMVRIEDKKGDIIKTFTPIKKEAISEELAWKMVYMLQGSTRERNGTAMGLHRLGNTLKDNEVAAKTGTTSNFSDGWFVGCVKDLVTGIWVGGDERSIHFHSTNEGQGARLAMPMWSYYMDSVYSNPATKITKGRFTRPASVNVELDCAKRKSSMQDSTTIETSEEIINYD